MHLAYAAEASWLRRNLIFVKDISDLIFESQAEVN